MARTRLAAPLLLAGGGALLSGCAASLAMSAASLAVRAAQPAGPDPRLDHRAAATEACAARAAGHGRARIIDAEQRADGRVVVWGTIEDAPPRRAFECRYDRRISSFTLRAIPAR